MQTDERREIAPQDLSVSAPPVQNRVMHPDDFEAHMAWVTAKRFHERIMNETFGEKAVYFRVLGPSFASSMR